MTETKPPDIFRSPEVVALSLKNLILIINDL